MLVLYLIYRVLQEWLSQDQTCILVTSLVFLQTGTINSFQLRYHQVCILHFVHSFFSLTLSNIEVYLSLQLCCIFCDREVVV